MRLLPGNLDRGGRLANAHGTAAAGRSNGTARGRVARRDGMEEGQQRTAAAHKLPPPHGD